VRVTGGVESPEADDQWLNATPSGFARRAPSANRGKYPVRFMSPPNYLTPSGAKQLADELQRLMSVERPKVVREVAEAAAQGDRSENAEYIYGKKRLREIDRRVHFLTKRLDSAVVVRPEELGGDVVRFGASVEVRGEDGVQKTYSLVGPDESDPSRGKLSFQSPIGQALMKRRVGDIVVVKRPAGEIELEIVGLKYGS
jgi:transcription elongation factor GreB